MKNNKLKMVLKIVCAVLCAAIIITGSVFIAVYVMQSDIDELQGRLDGTSSEIADIKDKYAAVLQELDALESAQEQTEADLTDLLAVHKNTTQEIGKLIGEIDGLKQAINASNEELDAAKQEIESLKAEIEELKNKHKAPKIRIYIDQGHNPTGYYNSGSSANGLYEQDLTFAIGVLLADMLEADGRFEVCLSRPTADTVLGTDNNSSLDARVEGAKNFEADYFISLHTNSYGDLALVDKVSGFEIYTAENDSESYRFGSSILSTLAASTNIRNRGMKIDADLRVLKNATMPAILIEMGFISNPDDAALMSENPELFANGIYNGILSYFDFLTPSAE